MRAAGADLHADAISGILTFVMATIVGGLVFLLPIGVVVVVGGKLLSISWRVGQLAHDRLFPGLDTQLVPLLLAIAMLLLIALSAGLFAQTPAGTRTFMRLEGVVLARLPAYTLHRQMLADMAGGSDSLSGRTDTKVVKVRFDVSVQVGFLIDEHPESDPVVFIPGAPSPFSGSVVVVERARIRETSLAPKAVFASMRRLGYTGWRTSQEWRSHPVTGRDQTICRCAFGRLDLSERIPAIPQMPQPLDYESQIGSGPPLPATADSRVHEAKPSQPQRAAA